MGISRHMVKRGEIWLTMLDPTEGRELRKTRPALILQNNIGNRYSPLTIIAPLTSKNVDSNYAFQVKLDLHETKLDRVSKVMLDQLRSVDKIRLVKKIGFVELLAMRRVDSALRIVLGLDV